jgi:hypothetical protein
MKAAVSQQPVSVAIDGMNLRFQMLGKDTVVDETFPCSSTSPNLAVTIVGYDSETWLVQNSWGSLWGDKGYFRVKMTEGPGVCGINLYGVYPVLI